VHQIDSDHDLSTGTRETTPLLVMLPAVAVPVGLVAWAAVSESVVVLVLAVLAMFAVGAGTLTFVMMLASQGHEQHGGDAPSE